MATNPYFRKAVPAEQDLIDDLSIEVIKINGFDMVYLPRTLVREDELFGEDRSPSRFSTGREIEMLVESVDGFEGDGEAFTRFGLEIKDNVTLLVARKRFEKEFADLGFLTPREGDLLYFPISGGIFEIDYVERENPFYQLNKISTYKITCSLFRYSGEDFNTGWNTIDGVTSDHTTQYTSLVLGAGSGNYNEGETVIQGAGSTIAGQVQEWLSASTTLYVTGLTGEFQAGITVEGQSSGTKYLLGSTGTTSHFAVNDTDEDNLEFEAETENLFDFTDTDPFSEGDL
tara:strand:+ start:1062 stop:1922 length:861 start_codon:yes stop_codon:yes gene_type:complete